MEKKNCRDFVHYGINCVDAYILKETLQMKKRMFFISK